MLQSSAAMSAIAMIALTPLAGTSGSGNRKDASEWKGDVAVLLDHILRKHAAPFRTLDRDQWREAAERLEASLSDLTPESAVWEFRRFVAKLDDSHTFFIAPRQVVRREWFPLLMRVFSDGLYVKTGHIDYRELFGKRITRIEGIPIAELFNRLRPFISADNEWAAIDKFKVLLREPSLLRHIGANRAPYNEVEYTYTAADGSSKTITVRSNSDSWVTGKWRDVDDPSTPLPYWREVDRNFDFRFLADGKALHFVCNKTRDEDDETLAAFFERMFSAAEVAMSKGELKRFIIDIRDNSGGNGYLWFPLMRWILRHPEIDRPGGLYVLISRDTFSAGCLLAFDLERWTHAVFIGEPTPHRPNFTGDTEPLTLPASGIKLRVSELLWQMSDPRDSRKWLTPDIVVVPSSWELLKRKDKLLEIALSYEPAGAIPVALNLKWSLAQERDAESAAPSVIRMLDGSLPSGAYVSPWPAKK